MCAGRPAGRPGAAFKMQAYRSHVYFTRTFAFKNTLVRVCVLRFAHVIGVNRPPGECAHRPLTHPMRRADIRDYAFARAAAAAAAASAIRFIVSNSSRSRFMCAPGTVYVCVCFMHVCAIRSTRDANSCYMVGHQSKNLLSARRADKRMWTNERACNL